MRLFDHAMMHGSAAASRSIVATRASGDGISQGSVSIASRGQGRDVVQAALATGSRDVSARRSADQSRSRSMLHALEVRSPFMDHELVHFAAALSTDQLLKRRPQAHAPRSLRRAICRRASSSAEDGLRRADRRMVSPRSSRSPPRRDALRADTLHAPAISIPTLVTRLIHEHDEQTQDHSQRLYALLMLELWWRTAK